MSTLVFLHAHPDDECLITGGTIALAAADGHRVVLVVATNGDHGEVPDDLAPGENLVARRRAETEASARTLGVERIVWLGYRDSGMTGWEQNADPENLMNASVDEAAERLAAMARYGLRFPIVGNLAQAPAAIVQAFAKVSWYRIDAKCLFFIDNSKGFGHRDRLDLG